jgi:sorbitol-specific phosphotransferase system component IIBC
MKHKTQEKTIQCFQRKLLSNSDTHQHLTQSSTSVLIIGTAIGGLIGQHFQTSHRLSSIVVKQIPILAPCGFVMDLLQTTLVGCAIGMLANAVVEPLCRNFQSGDKQLLDHKNFMKRARISLAIIPMQS